MKRTAILAGLLGPFIGISGMTLAAFLNRGWWDPRITSISHLGKYQDPTVSYPSILNVSLVTCGAVTLLYSLGFLKYEWMRAHRRRIFPTLGPAFYSAGLISLIFVGLFPSGTLLHYPASIGFYLLTQAAVLLVAVTHRRDGYYAFLSISILIVGGVSMYAFLWIWEGDGMGELAWVAAVVFWHYVTLHRINLSRGAGKYGKSIR